MEFTLTIDLDKLSGDTGHEVARILRYWAGAIKAADLKPGTAMNVYDPHYHRVGRWHVDESAPAVAEDEPEAPLAERAAPPEPPSVPGDRME